MAKFAADTLMDQALNYVVNNGDLLVMCNGQPATHADATTDNGSGGNALGETTITSADYTGPADGDTSGRKITVNQQTGVDVDVSADCDHVAVTDTNNTELLLVTTVTTQTLTAGNTATINAFDYEIQDV